MSPETARIAPFLSLVGPSKVRISREGVAVFNAYWPCRGQAELPNGTPCVPCTLRPTRAYWFEFDDYGNLADTDVPECDEGPEVVALAADCLAWLES